MEVSERMKLLAVRFRLAGNKAYADLMGRDGEHPEGHIMAWTHGQLDVLEEDLNDDTR